MFTAFGLLHKNDALLAKVTALNTNLHFALIYSSLFLVIHYVIYVYIYPLPKAPRRRQWPIAVRQALHQAPRTAPGPADGCLRGVAGRRCKASTQREEVAIQYQKLRNIQQHSFHGFCSNLLCFGLICFAGWSRTSLSLQSTIELDSDVLRLCTCSFKEVVT